MQSLVKFLRSTPKELELLGVLLLMILGIWALALIVAEFGYPRIQKFDERILVALRDPHDVAVPIGPHWLLGTAREISALGSSTVLVLLIFSVIGYLWLERRYGVLALVVVSTAGATLISVMLKDVLGRSRPTVVPHLVSVSSPSFPSGHSLLSAAVYLTLGTLLARVTTDRITKLYLVGLSATLAILIGASRVYLGVHYPTDVLGGWTIGFLWSFACGLVARELQRRRVIAPVETRSSQRVTRSTSAA
jgi:undecaprenyl-diphosphatase